MADVTEMTPTLCFGSICSGIGGAELAWSSLGWRSAWCAEIDPFASAVLAARFPDTPNRGDFTKIGQEVQADAVDVLVGGTPCQAFSVAGKRAGLDDPRGNLTLEFLGLVGRLLPRWVVWENVPGVLSIDGGRTFGTVLGLLGELGYGFAYRILDAQFFGLAQRRRRVFVVAYRGDWRPPAAVLFEPESVSGDSPTRREAGADAAGALGCGSPASGGRIGPDEVAAHQVVALRDDVDTYVTHSLRADRFDASEDGTGRGTPLVSYSLRRDANRDGEAQTLSADADGRMRLRDPGFGVYEEVAPTVDHAPHSVATFAADDYRTGSYEEAETARPLTTSADRTRAAPLVRMDTYLGAEVISGLDANYGKGPGARGGAERPVVVTPQSAAVRILTPFDPTQPYALTSPSDGGRGQERNIMTTNAVRRLTPRECERLQGYPDDFTLIEYRGKPAADGPRYRALGNSFAIPVVRWIGKRLARCDGALRSLSKTERAA